MASQLALFPGMVPIEAVEAPVAPEPHVEAEPGPAPLSTPQMGLFDAQVRRLRAAIHAVEIADLPSAIWLLQELTPEFDPVVPSMRQRVAELHAELERVHTLPLPVQVAAHLELGRPLAAEGDPWSSLGRALIARAAADLGPAEGVLAARLLMEAGELERARSVLLVIPGPRNAGALFALGDVARGTLRGRDDRR
jgi:hypothetical protein